MENKHFTQLDGLRFFAVLMVIIGHWLQWTWTNPFLKALPLVHGVTLFFVLSGFLITRILFINGDRCIQENTSVSQVLKSFYIRRALRIFPVYFLLVFFLFAIDYQNTRVLFPWIVSFSTNIYQSIHNAYVGNFNHFWSLAVEEQFYLFWPFVILFTKHRYRVHVILGTIVIAISYKWYLFMYVGKWMATSYSTLSCMHALGIGALVAYVALYEDKLVEVLTQTRWMIILFTLYVVMLVVQHQISLRWYTAIGDEMLFALLSALVILKASQKGFSGLTKKILENKIIVHAGKVSYGMYLFHLFIPSLYDFIGTFVNIKLNNEYASTVIHGLITFLLAHLSLRYLETPINKLKSRFEYVKKQGAI